MNTKLKIQNLKCGGCANTIITRLSNIDGLSDISVNNDAYYVSFNYSDDKTLKEAVDLLSQIGYPVEGAENPLIKKAKSYVSCAVGRMNK
jgi:copper chaperone CopZ